MIPRNNVTPAKATRRPEPVHCAVGDTLCELRVLSPAEWDALPPDRRPATAEYAPGLGWVVATPGRAK